MNRYLTIIVMCLMLLGCAGVSAQDSIFSVPEPELDPATEVVLLRIQIEQMEKEIIELKLLNDACHSDVLVCYNEVWSGKSALHNCEQRLMKTL